MKLVILATAAAAATALAFTPALAKTKHHRMHYYSQMQSGGMQQSGMQQSGMQQNGWNNGWNGGGNAGYGGWNNGYGGWNNGWNSRNVSDPSLGHPSAGAISRYSGRCVEDLGYGRYEACGW